METVDTPQVEEKITHDEYFGLRMPDGRFHHQQGYAQVSIKDGLIHIKIEGAMYPEPEYRDQLLTQVQIALTKIINTLKYRPPEV